MVERLFLPHDITILSIPLSHRLPDDSIIWVVAKHDNFSVKSAYPIHLTYWKENMKGRAQMVTQRNPFGRKCGCYKSMNRTHS